MFQFPGYAFNHPMYSGEDTTPLRAVGFPIRKSSDLSSVDSSPRHIAASHVLHRLLMPRHPPYALNNLHHKRSKMLASTIQFSNTNQKPRPKENTYTQTPNRHPGRFELGRALTDPRSRNNTACCLRTQQCAALASSICCFSLI